MPVKESKKTYHTQPSLQCPILGKVVIQRVSGHSISGEVAQEEVQSLQEQKVKQPSIKGLTLLETQEEYLCPWAWLKSMEILVHSNYKETVMTATCRPDRSLTIRSREVTGKEELSRLKEVSKTDLKKFRVYLCSRGLKTMYQSASH